jgi:hypothetical protein
VLLKTLKYQYLTRLDCVYIGFWELSLTFLYREQSAGVDIRKV